MNKLAKILLCLFALFSMRATAQSLRDRLTGDWKFYLDDKISFELLRLNSDGSGLKCFGQTINGKDTLFTNHVTALSITGWKVNDSTLVLSSRNTLSFKIKPNYKYKFVDNGKIEVMGENLIFYLYPSILNRKEFYRAVVFQKAGNFAVGYGVSASTCITGEKIILFKPVDAGTHLAVYKGFENLIPSIISCGTGFEFAGKYNDPPYTLSVPTFINHWSHGFGNKLFYISLGAENNDSSETSIVIYYDFANEMKDYYFAQIKAGKEKKDVVKKGSFNIYKTINWQGKFEGKIFLDNAIVVAYYTKYKKLEEKLETCITSFKYN